MNLGKLINISTINKPILLLIASLLVAILLFFIAISITDSYPYELRDNVIKIDAYLSNFEASTDQKIKQKEMKKVDSLLKLIEKDYKNTVAYLRCLGKAQILKGDILNSYNTLVTARSKDKKTKIYRDLDRLTYLSSIFLSDIFLNRNQSMDAGRVIDYGLRIIPNSDQLLNNKGRYFQQMNIEDSSLVYFNKAFNANPNNNKIRSNFFMQLIKLGDASFNTKNYNNALNMYITAEKLDAKNEGLMIQIAKVFKIIGQIDKANIYYQKVLKINPNNQLAISGIQ